jgi:hypothetical protein
MLATVLVYLCTELECFLQDCNNFVQSWNAFYRVGMLSTGLACFLQSWHAFDRSGIHLYTVGMLSTGF